METDETRFSPMQVGIKKRFKTKTPLTKQIVPQIWNPGSKHSFFCLHFGIWSDQKTSAQGVYVDLCGNEGLEMEQKHKPLWNPLVPY